MLVSTIITDMQTELADSAGVRWTTAICIAAINDGTLATVLVRPDANASTENISLVAGTRQSLNAGMFRLLDVTRNMGANGSTPGNFVDFSEFDAQRVANPGWSSTTASAIINDVFYDYKRDPLKFWVNPPASIPSYVEVIASKAPTVITAIGDTFPLPDIYKPAVLEWALFRCFSVQVQSSTNQAKAAAKKQSFYQLLGIKTQVEATATNE